MLPSKCYFKPSQQSFEAKLSKKLKIIICYFRHLYASIRIFFFDSVTSHFKHFRIKYYPQNIILNLPNKALAQHCQKYQLIQKSVILYIYTHLFCLPIFFMVSLATFVQFFMFWNRIFFSECFDDINFFAAFGGVKGDFW